MDLGEKRARDSWARHGYGMAWQSWQGSSVSKIAVRRDRVIFDGTDGSSCRKCLRVC